MVVDKMMTALPHTFHIPVMGLGYTVDTPVKVARFGINSVVSIIQDQLLEQMRAHYSRLQGIEFIPIPHADPAHRSKRVTAYLDLLGDIVERQMQRIKTEPFTPGSEIMKYFRMLPDGTEMRKRFQELLTKSGELKDKLEQELRAMMIAGSIDVNIMTKVDSPAYSSAGELMPYPYSLAAAALKGYAESKLRSSVIFSAGLNPRLFSFLGEFPDFFPDENGEIKKKVILKVSDLRSARIQGMFLAKKGIWVSEFRVESGLNCGGHAFPTDGLLMGPILQELKNARKELNEQLILSCNKALREAGKSTLPETAQFRVSVQGGIGTHEEDEMLRHHFGADSTGWGSPFLLVPEATNVDANTLAALGRAKPEDYYLSNASPLGIPFNNFKLSSGENVRIERIRQGHPGSPCYLGYLSFNTEFTERPICVSSRQYQHDKIRLIQSSGAKLSEREEMINRIEEKECLCEGLSATALLCNHIPVPHKMEAVTICPGPNLAYFSGSFSLEEMLDHIYGRTNLLNTQPRPSMFEKELKMYLEYLEKGLDEGDSLKVKQPEEFAKNLDLGISYYKKQSLDHPEFFRFGAGVLEKCEKELERLTDKAILIKQPS